MKLLPMPGSWKALFWGLFLLMGTTSSRSREPVLLPCLTSLYGFREARRSIYDYVPRFDYAVRWHPNNRYLLSRFGIVALAPKASIARPLRFDKIRLRDSFMEGGCDWDPKAERLVLSRLPGKYGAFELFLTPVAKLALTKLVGADFGAYNVCPSWEPTGERIAFLSENGEPFACASSMRMAPIYVCLCPPI
jgi:hypothetical protein